MLERHCLCIECSSRCGVRKLTSLEDTFTRDRLSFSTEANTTVSGAVSKFEDHLGRVFLTEGRACSRGEEKSLAVNGGGDLACAQRRGGHFECLKKKENGNRKRNDFGKKESDMNLE